jgi:hypothetical protein
MFFARRELRLKNQLIIANCRNKRPVCLSSWRDIASNLTIYDILFITDCKLAYYVEILTMLCGAVCRERSELWPIFGFPIVTVFQVTECSVSGSLWQKVEQLSIAVLYTSLFSRHCHCSTQLFFSTKQLTSLCFIQFPLCAFWNQLLRVHSSCVFICLIYSDYYREAFHDIFLLTVQLHCYWYFVYSILYQIIVVIVYHIQPKC